MGAPNVTEERHSIVSPSSASRWMACPASALLCASVEERTSDYAAEGRKAHRLAELWLLNEVDSSTGRPWANDDARANPHFESWGAEVQSIHDEFVADHGQDYAKEVLRHVKTYTSHVLHTWTRSKGSRMEVEFKAPLFYKPEDDGTVDSLIYGGEDRTLYVTDLKFGQGVPVKAAHNKQLIIYAISALDKLALWKSVDRVILTICQPRRDYTGVWETTTDELDLYRDIIARGAKRALDPNATCKAGPHCKTGFCKVKSRCRALRDYTNAVMAGYEMKDPRLLTLDEVAAVLPAVPTITDWAKSVVSYAHEMAMKGESVRGYKLVATLGNRSVTDFGALLDALVAAGYDRPLLMRRSPKPLGEIEKLIAKEDREALISPFVHRPEGVALVEESDPRPAYGITAAREAFAEYGEKA